MTKLYLDSEKIKQSILPSLDDSTNYLSAEIRRLSNVSIPYDFKYRSRLYTISNDLSKIKSNIINTYDSLNSIIKKISNNEKQAERLLTSLSKKQILVRNFDD